MIVHSYLGDIADTYTLGRPLITSLKFNDIPKELAFPVINDQIFNSINVLFEIHSILIVRKVEQTEHTVMNSCISMLNNRHVESGSASHSTSVLTFWMYLGLTAIS